MVGFILGSLQKKGYLHVTLNSPFPLLYDGDPFRMLFCWSDNLYLLTIPTDLNQDKIFFSSAVLHISEWQDIQCNKLQGGTKVWLICFGSPPLLLDAVNTGKKCFPLNAIQKYLRILTKCFGLWKLAYYSLKSSIRTCFPKAAKINENTDTFEWPQLYLQHLPVETDCQNKV